MPWFLASPRHWHSWYCLFKVGVNWIMRGSILIILAVSLFKSDRNCTYICALQNEIGTHKLELFNNNRFTLTIEIVKMNIFPLRIPNYLYISWKCYTNFQCTEITQGDKIFFRGNQGPSYTLGKKGCYTPIEDNKTNVDRTFVFPLGWNWHDMDPWLFPNELRHYLGQTFNARSRGIVELRNHSIGGRCPKSIFTLWQLWINICIFFQKFFWLFEECPVQPLWILGMRCLHLPVRALSKVLLLPVWVWLVLPSTAYSKGMLPMDHWCQASLQGLPERQHLGKTVHCWGWSDRIVSWVLGPWRRGWEICTEWGLVAQWLTTDSCPVVTGHIDP